jgi:hypothetical protein
MVKKRKSNSLVGTMVGTGLGTLVGMGMMGATAGMVNQMPTGTAKSIAGVIPGLQAASLVAYNTKPFGKQKGSNNLKAKKSIW